ncbi:MAG TPA: hypothetical protein VN975_15055 [Xanthobacteraceae bacterium]|jgi:hypothetical protein|nr:hypothetical protein [Xanthobacteraceae bacterium]
MRLTVAALLAMLVVPAYAGALRHYPSPLLPPLYGGGYTPLDGAATVFPPPRRCLCRGSHRVVLHTRHARKAHRIFVCHRFGR